MLEVFLFVLGLIVGSFANVCVYRLPREESVVRPWSHCPSCGKGISWYDNIPILSFILLRGRCRICKGRISFQYSLIEALTGFFFLAAFMHVGLSPVLVLYWYFFTLLIIASFTDFNHLIIPDAVSIPGMVIGIAASFLFPQMMESPSRAEAAISSLRGLAAGGGAIWLIGVFGKAIFRKEAMGGGDVKLMAMVGSFLGTKLTFLGIFFGSVFGAMIGGLLILLRLKTRKDYIPFGPYLSLGAVVSFFIGEKLLEWYFGLLGG